MTKRHFVSPSIKDLACYSPPQSIKFRSPPVTSRNPLLSQNIHRENKIKDITRKNILKSVLKKSGHSYTKKRKTYEVRTPGPQHNIHSPIITTTRNAQQISTVKHKFNKRNKPGSNHFKWHSPHITGPVFSSLWHPLQFKWYAFISVIF